MAKSGDSANISDLRGLVAYNFDLGNRFQPFVRTGVGSAWLHTSSKLVANGQDGDTVFLLGLGTRVHLTEAVALRLDLVSLSVPVRNREVGGEFEAMLGVSYLLGGKDGSDADHDGIADAQDKCPNEAEDKDGFQDQDGCADNDNDGDGVADAQDKCPKDPETKNGYQDEDGCPDEVPVADEDKDGIPDARDKCPKQAETKNGHQDDDGCPDEVPVADEDKDGIPDARDKCPKQAETKNSYQDEDGCPDTVPEKLKSLTGTIEGILFETNSAEIKANSFEILQKAAKLLKEFKDTKVAIEGHTDNEGDETANQALSLERAKSVQRWLVAHGVAESRLTVAGFGASKPVASNATSAGRAENRRIEFKVQ
jgi:outer membrane protein OmpA-like peptidoglycan-associated protein